MLTSKLFLVSEFELDQVFSCEVAAALGLGFEHVKSDELLDAIERCEGRCLVFYGISEPGAEQTFKQLLFPRIAAHANVSYPTLHPELVHIIGSLDLDEVSGLGMNSSFGSFILRDEYDPKVAARRYATILRPMVARRLALGRCAEEEPRTGGLDAQLELRHSDDKHVALAMLEKRLSEGAGYPNFLLNRIVTAVDELLMNAFYDAPPDPDGNQRLRATPRSLPIQLPSAHSIQLRVREDEESVIVSVTDSYGSLKRGKVLDHILRNYRKSAHRVDQATFGAGIGLAITFRMGGSLLFAVTPGRKTEVTVVFPKSKSYRKFRAQFRFVAVQVDMP